MAALRSKILAEVGGKGTATPPQNTNNDQKPTPRASEHKEQEQKRSNSAIKNSTSPKEENVSTDNKNKRGLEYGTNREIQRDSPNLLRKGSDNNPNKEISKSSIASDPRRGPSHIDYSNQRRQDSRRGPSMPVDQSTSRFENLPRYTSRDRQIRFKKNDNETSNFNQGYNGGGGFQSNNGNDSRGNRFNNRDREFYSNNSFDSRNNNFRTNSNVSRNESETGSARGNVERSRNVPHNGRGRYEQSRSRFGSKPADRYRTANSNSSSGWQSQNSFSNENTNARTVVPSYEAILKTLTNIRLNRIVTVTPMIPGFEDHITVASTIKHFVENVDYGMETENEVTSVKIAKNRIIVEFNKESLVTVILTCQKFLESEVNSQFIWSRPHGYINDIGNEEPILSQSVLSLLKLGPECEDEESTKQWLVDEQIKYDWLQLIKYKNTAAEGHIWVNALLYIPKSEEQKRLPMTIKPNQTATIQNFKSITYENFPAMVNLKQKKPSKVICVLNSVDPMDLKNEKFVTEIKEAMMNSTPVKNCGEVESVQIPLPNPDYRNDMNHINSSIGKVFIKFKDVAGAEQAMLKLPGSQFCQRTIICSYYSEADFDMGIL